MMPVAHHLMITTHWKRQGAFRTTATPVARGSIRKAARMISVLHHVTPVRAKLRRGMWCSGVLISVLTAVASDPLAQWFGCHGMASIGPRPFAPGLLAV